MSKLSTDPIADMLSRIRNAILAGKSQIALPHSKIKYAIAEQLKKAGYLAELRTLEAKPHNLMQITINEPGTSPVITEIARLSKPGRRLYATADEIPRIKNGRGIVLLSTSKGIVPGAAARKLRLGGELICKVY